jgi:hypothetical protein
MKLLLYLRVSQRGYRALRSDLTALEYMRRDEDG